MDIRVVCNIFLDFIYDNKILPDKIVEGLKKLQTDRDFRILCHILKYKEDCYSHYEPDPLSDGKKKYLPETKKFIKDNRFFLSDISIWRDVISEQKLMYLHDVTNNFFHNVSLDDGQFCLMLNGLLEQTPSNYNGKEYIRKIEQASKTNDQISFNEPLFYGDFDSFWLYLNDYVKNKVPLLTKKYKGSVCSLCKREAELQAAHKKGQERKTIVKNLFFQMGKPLSDNKYAINLTFFAEQINKFHSDPDNFYFLCQDCHKKYDKGEISEEQIIAEVFSTKDRDVPVSNKINEIEKTGKIGKIGGGNLKGWPFKRNKKGAIDFCKSKGCSFWGQICFASIKSSLWRSREVYWADNDDSLFLKNDWFFVLNNQDKHCFHVIFVPKGALTPDLEKANRNRTRFDWNIDVKTYIDIDSGFDFKDFNIVNIPYSDEDIDLYDVK